MPTWAAFLVFALSLTSRIFGKLVNVTLDDAFVGPDQFGASITYAGLVGTGDNHWHASSPSNPCIGCNIQPDPTKVFNSTWHDGSVDGPSNTSLPTLEMTLSFSGVGVYVYGVVYHAPGTVLQTFVQFQLNNETAQIISIPNGVRKATTYLYNQTFFAQEGLADGPHVLIATIPSQPGIAAEMVFDYVVYTRNTSSPTASTPSKSTPKPAAPKATPQSRSNIGVIVGGAAGGIVGASGVLGIFLWWYLRRRKRRISEGSLDLLQGSSSGHNQDAAPSPQMRQSPYPFPVHDDTQDDHIPVRPDSTEPPMSVYSGAVPLDPHPRRDSSMPDISEMLMSEVAQLRAEVHALRNETPPQYDVDEVAHSGLPYLTG